MVPAIGLSSDSVCAQGCFVTTDRSACKSFLLLSVLQAPYCLSFRCSTLRYGGLGRLDISFRDLDRSEASPVLQRDCWSGKLWRQIWDLGGRSMHRHRVFQRRYFFHEFGYRLQPTPAAAAADQLRCANSSRLVAVRAAARCETGFLPAPRTMGRVRVCSGKVAPLGSSKPFVSRQQVVLVLPLICESDALEKEKKLDSERVFVVRMQTTTSWTIASGRSSLSVCRFQITTSATTKPRRSYCVFCCRRPSSITVCKDSASTSRASEKNLVQGSWLCLRGIASCECAILPIREIATHSRCSGCEHASPGERTTARWSLPAPEAGNTFLAASRKSA